MKIYECQRSRSLCFQQVQTSSTQKPSGLLNPNFMWNLHGMGNEIFSYGPGNMTKMAAMPIYDKTFNTLLL